MIHFFLEDATVDLSLLATVDQWLGNVAHQEGLSIQLINIVFGSDEYLLSINQQYLQHDYYTDIITFDQRDDPDLPIEGDIFISVDRVRDNASQYCKTFHQELLRVIVHGLLHLMGYDDTTDELKRQMRCLEDRCLHSYPNS